ncbi:MAG: calcium-binding protein [Myxococcales bacterium]|nr:calcium-binding protein [Myxococcales bacterium]MCB9706603.1 calcium-binding protein [Myxococcales bacterium]
MVRIDRALAPALALLAGFALLSGCDAEEPDDSGSNLEIDGSEGGGPGEGLWRATPCGGEVTEVECQTSEGEEGVSFCLQVSGEEAWTACTVDPACLPGESSDNGCFGTYCAYDGQHLVEHSWAVEGECGTPLVVVLDDEPLGYEPVSGADFDLTGRGDCLGTDWPTVPWLALDRDGDGVISGGRELFGEGWIMASGTDASHGFEALIELDADRDGMITAADPAFAELVLWSDLDGDRRGELRELTPIAEAGLFAIHLDFARKVECDERGNCAGERARVEYIGAGGEPRRGEVIDVYLACE